LNYKKTTVGITTKKTSSTMMVAAAAITPVFSSAARILGIQRQRSKQMIERKGITNKKIYLYYLAGTMIAMAGILHLVVASNLLGGLEGIIRSLAGPGLLNATFNIAKLGFFFLVAGIAQLFWSVPMTKRWEENGTISEYAEP
jgi:hypothetical protein